MKLKFVTLFICFISISFAQQEQKFAIGIQVSPTLYLMDTYHYSPNAKFKTLIEYLAGISGQFYLNSRFTFHHELNFGRAGYVTYVDKGYGVSPLFKAPIVQSTTYIYIISIPITIRFNVIKREKSNFFLCAGTFSDYIQRQSTNYLLENGDTYFFTYRRGDKSFGVTGGLGFERKLSKRFDFFAEARDHIPINQFGDVINLVTLFVGASFRL